MEKIFVDKEEESMISIKMLQDLEDQIEKIAQDKEKIEKGQG